MRKKEKDTSKNVNSKGRSPTYLHNKSENRKREGKWEKREEWDKREREKRGKWVNTREMGHRGNGRFRGKRSLG